MHRPTAAVLGLVAVGAASAYVLPRLAEAGQTIPPAAATMPAPPRPAGPGMPGMPMQHGPWMKHGPWMHEGHRGPMPPQMMMMHRMMQRFHQRMATWGLFYHTPDKHLTAADVSTIAKAILAMHGNHTWQVGDVTAPASGPGGFAFTAKDGTVIARFTIDLRTGRLHRAG